MEFSKYKKIYNYSYTLGAFPTLELITNKKENVLKVFIHTSFKNEDVLNTIYSKLDKEKIEITSSNKIFNILSSDKENVFIIDSYEINLRLDLLLSSDFTFIDYLNTPLIKDSIYCRCIPLYFNKYESKVKTLGIVNSFSFSNFLDFSKLLVDCFQIQKNNNILNTCCHKNADDYKQEIFLDYFELLDEEMKGKVSKK